MTQLDLRVNGMLDEGSAQFWIDFHLDRSDSLTEQIRDAIRQSSLFLMIGSPRYLKSERGPFTKGKKSYARLKIPCGALPQNYRMRRKCNGRKESIRLTTRGKKSAVMQFYDVTLAQSVPENDLTYDFFRYSEFLRYSELSTRAGALSR